LGDTYNRSKDTSHNNVEN